MRYLKSVKRKVVFTSLFFSLIAILSCERNIELPKESSVFLMAAEYYNIQDIGGWILKKELAENNVSFNDLQKKYSGGVFYFQKINEDTISRIVIEYYSSTDDTIFNPIEYYKRYEESSFFQHVILYGEGGDTLFYYRSEMFGMLIKTFYIGKYYYQYKFHELNKKERLFFDRNRDSLISIRGNNLPKLKIQQN